ncbi:unnamed protein product [Caenorhabditis brenneri]
MLALLFLFSFLLHPTDTCLKINLLVPPKCECRAYPITSEDALQSSDFHFNLTQHFLQPPIVSIDDCSVTMYCEGEYSLVVFKDDDNYELFGAYSADGFCDSYTQSWLIEDESGLLSTYKNLSGVCIDFRSDRYTTKGPYNSGYCWACPYNLLSHENVTEIMKDNVWYQTNLTHYDFKTPEITERSQFDWSCVERMGCPENHKLVMFWYDQMHIFNAEDLHITCAEHLTNFDTFSWGIVNSSPVIDFPTFSAACVDFNNP